MFDINEREEYPKNDLNGIFTENTFHEFDDSDTAFEEIYDGEPFTSDNLERNDGTM